MVQTRAKITQRKRTGNAMSETKFKLVLILTLFIGFLYVCFTNLVLTRKMFMKSYEQV